MVDDGTWDDLFFSTNEVTVPEVQQRPPSLPSSPTTSSNESSDHLDILSTFVQDFKKRRLESQSETELIQTEPKKSKQLPSYMRRNIRHLFSNDKLQQDTLQALKAEQDRLKRLDDINDHYFDHSRFSTGFQLLNNGSKECIVLEDEDEQQQKSDVTTRNTLDDDIQCIDSNDTEIVSDNTTKKLQRLHLDDRVNQPNENGDILVNLSHPDDEPDLYITKHLCSILKPHQIGGIRFLYDNIVESLQQFPQTSGLGCILAHSMGCGKTLQVITFIDIFLNYTGAKSVLIIVPVNTIQNWANEFNRWCPKVDPNLNYQRPYQLYIINELAKNFPQRANIVLNWLETGGALILGYEMFRLLVTAKASSIKSNTQSTLLTQFDQDEDERNLETVAKVKRALFETDLVICDEGHRIKNHQASVASALKSIRTHRRIALTGYPLQNNLVEYWCMVDFVRPNYLGRKKEFCNMFERPIMNGQCVDSTGEDRQLMRARAHVLQTLLEGFIQRRNADVLQVDLPSKTEYVLLLKLSPIQQQLYFNFLHGIGALLNSSRNPINVLRAFAICCKIWNHADVLHKSVRDRLDGTDLDIDLDADSSNRSISQDSSDKKTFSYEFAQSIFNSYLPGQLSNGIKFQVALTILDRSIELGDKVLLFTQSLLSLNKFEEFLGQRTVKNTNEKWEKNVNYYRLDGATNSLEREKLINAFNAPHSNAKLFLLSTRAGCLGVNLIAANRVIIMDVSWNPCHDAQAVCRVYRYGQQKHCYIYRLIADFTMEKRIYDRQIAKQGMSDHLVDQLQPQNPINSNELRNLLYFATKEEPIIFDLPKKIRDCTDDSVLISICDEHFQSITKLPSTHESLLSDRDDYQLTPAEKRRAQRQYQEAKRLNLVSSRTKYSTTRISTPLTIPKPPMPVDQRLEQLKNKGFDIQLILLRAPLEVRISQTERQTIPAGTQIQLIKTSRGSYIRSPEGKFFAIRSSPPKPAPIVPEPPPTSNFFDDLFQDFPSLSNNNADPLVNLNSSSTNDQFSNWSDDYFSSDMFDDVLNDSINPTLDSFLSTPLTFP